MGRFSRRPLGLLDGIYGFVGGLKGVDRIDLGSDITVVHDVSRQAEKSGITGYYGWAIWQGTASVNGLDYPEWTRYADVQDALGVHDENYEMYVMGGSAWVNGVDKGNVAQISYAIHNVVTPKRLLQMGGPDTIRDPLATFLTADIPTILTFGTVGFHPAAPIRVLPNSKLVMHLQTTALTLIHWTWDLWIGAEGASPPGLG